jgi:hypothetical protein
MRANCIQVQVHHDMQIVIVALPHRVINLEVHLNNMNNYIICNNCKCMYNTSLCKNCRECGSLLRQKSHI